MRYVDDTLMLIKPNDIPIVLEKFNSFNKNFCDCYTFVCLKYKDKFCNSYTVEIYLFEILRQIM